MAKTIELNHAGITALLQSADMQSAIMQQAQTQGEVIKQYITGDRVCALVKTGDTNDDRSKNH